MGVQGVKVQKSIPLLWLLPYVVLFSPWPPKVALKCNTCTCLQNWKNWQFLNWRKVLSWYPPLSPPDKKFPRAPSLPGQKLLPPCWKPLFPSMRVRPRKIVPHRNPKKEKRYKAHGLVFAGWAGQDFSRLWQAQPKGARGDTIDIVHSEYTFCASTHTLLGQLEERGGSD